MVLAVIDASVAVKWIIPESGSPAALDLLRGSLTLAAPALIRLEVHGAVLRRYRLNTLEEQSARHASESWERILRESEFHLVPTEELLELAVSLAFRLRHPLPDCLYLAAAKALQSKLITADRALAERGREVHPQIVLFGEAA